MQCDAGPATAPVPTAAEDLPVVGESEAAAFRAFGEWHEFSDGTRGKIDLIDVQLPADPDYPKQYPARQALQVRMTVDNPTGETIGNAVNMGPRFATAPRTSR